MRRYFFFGAGIAGFVAALLSGCPFSFAATCALNGTGKDVKEIAASCEALMDTMDATDAKKQAFTLCCRSANEYLKKNPVSCSDKAKVRYRIKLAFAVCDAIKAPELSYEHDYCVNQMLYHIPDPKVLEIADKCSPSDGRTAGAGRGGRGGKEGNKDGGKGSRGDKGDQKPIDLHLDDESYSKCQRTRLNKYIEQLDDEIKSGPADATFCSQAKG